jgi:hypothetical protein
MAGSLISCVRTDITEKLGRLERTGWGISRPGFLGQVEASVHRLVVVCSLRREWCGDRVVTARNSGFRQLQLGACRAAGYRLSRTKPSVAVKLL